MDNIRFVLEIQEYGKLKTLYGSNNRDEFIKETKRLVYDIIENKSFHGEDGIKNISIKYHTNF